MPSRILFPVDGVVRQFFGRRWVELRATGCGEILAAGIGIRIALSAMFWRPSVKVAGICPLDHCGTPKASIQMVFQATQSDDEK
jgi:hypothetical protein